MLKTESMIILFVIGELILEENHLNLEQITDNNIESKIFVTNSIGHKTYNT